LSRILNKTSLLIELKADFKSMKTKMDSSDFFWDLIYCIKEYILTWVPKFGTNPIWFLSRWLIEYFLSLYANLSSKNLNKGDKTTIGLKSSGFGMFGHTLFNGMSLLCPNCGFYSRISFLHRS
jgi:hypothetical protein